MLNSNNLIGFGGVTDSGANHRYWRSTKTDAATGTNTTMELRVKDAAGNVVTVTSGMLTQSGLGSFNAAQTVDGSTATIAFTVDAAGPGSYLQIDFGAGNEKELHTWEFYVNGTQASTWDIAASDDGSTMLPNSYTGLSCSVPTGAGYKTATW